MKSRECFNKMVELYLLGDKIGSRFETGLDIYSPKFISSIKKKITETTTGTDESDIITTFIQFVDGVIGIKYLMKEDFDEFIVQWATYHYKNRKSNSYGSSYKNLFFAIKYYINNKEKITIDALKNSSTGSGSFGNGCIPLVYPMYFYLNYWDFNLNQIFNNIIRMTEITHSHKISICAVTILTCIFDVINNGRNIFDTKNYDKYRRYFTNMEVGMYLFYKFLNGDMFNPPNYMVQNFTSTSSLGLILYALYSVNRSTNIVNLVENVISMNGDVDSVLSLTMLIYGLINTPNIDAEKNMLEIMLFTKKE